jgi:hypothetical protein
MWVCRLAFDIVSILVSIVVGVVVTAPVLWIAGRLLVGAAKAKFTDAVVIVVLGSIAGGVIGAVVSGTVGTLAQLVVLLFLIRKYYECDWLRALAVAVVTVVIFIVIIFVLGVLGFALLGPSFQY